ncbi:MAG TPA: HAD family hydrolase [Thermoplasmata archaeon]|jgi:putative hydrolase of the HAD superfamily|nr:HAD family hydrolase [Thermoplasmata archaeon]
MRRRPSTKVLLIDIGNVVIRDPRPLITRELVRRARADPTRMRASYYRTALRMASGSLGLREAYRALRTRFRWSIPYAEFREIVGWRTLHAIPGVLPTLRILHRKGAVRIVYASNVEPVTWNGLRRKYRVDECADAAALSFRLRALKPARRFFLGAIRIARVAPAEIFYLDDLPENIRAARRLGIPAQRVRSPGDTLAALRRLRTGNSRKGGRRAQSM